jgi:streptomycin 6-kinase
MSRFSSLELDDGVRRRLTLRFGDEVESWFNALPAVLDSLTERWQLELESFIPRGSVSVVLRCRMHGSFPAVLKVSPDRVRIAREGAALERWHTAHTPNVMGVDGDAGALLIEAIEPGDPLDELSAYPSLERVGDLVTSLHTQGIPDPAYPSLAERISYLFDSGKKLYRQDPDLLDVVPVDVYERGRQVALGLAVQPSRTVLLHGDLTPRNVLLGGETRGLVAIDPAPCLGDPAFDTVDLLFWQADDVDAAATRAKLLALTTGMDPDRMLDWCRAFAGMMALDIASSPNSSLPYIQSLVRFAVSAGPEH